MKNVFLNKYFIFNFIFKKYCFYVQSGLFGTVRGEPVLKSVGGFGESN